MSISAFAMLPGVLGWFLPTLLISQAKTQDAFKLSLLSVISSAVVAAATIWFGITTMLAAIVVANFLMLPIRFKIVMKHISIDIKKLIVSVFPQYICAFGMFICIMLCKVFLDTHISNDILLLITLILVGILSYIILCFAFFYKSTHIQVKEIKNMFLKTGKVHTQN